MSLWTVGYYHEDQFLASDLMPWNEMRKEVNRLIDEIGYAYIAQSGASTWQKISLPLPELPVS